MNLPLVLFIAAAIIVVVLSFKMLSGILRVVFNILGFAFFILAIISVILYLDGRKAGELFKEGEKVLLYETGDELVAGVRVAKEELLVKSEDGLPENVKALGEEGRAPYEPLLAGKKLPNDKELVVVFRDESFEDSYVPLEALDGTIGRELFDALMNSDEPKVLLAREMAAEQGLAVQDSEAFARDVEEATGGMTDDEFKAALFLAELSLVLREEEKAQFLVTQLKSKNLLLSPQFLTVRLIDRIPSKAFEQGLSLSLTLFEKEGD